MKGSEAQLLGFLEGANNRYIIPVYQRNYDWKISHCRQLYEDLKKTVLKNKECHFFGSIVSQVNPEGRKINFHIIDGQQRLTTVTLLLLAICNLIKAQKVTPSESALDEQIKERFIIDKWSNADDKIKLCPVKKDRSALKKLVEGDEAEYELNSNLTTNYKYFCEEISKQEISVDQLYSAIGRLQIINITLDHPDDPQLIFESLNSTGLALTEGDKIRNYILMGLTSKKQEYYYETFWTKIEQCIENNDISSFARDYLSIKQQKTPAFRNVYQTFKTYVEEKKILRDNLLEDMLLYARIYRKLLQGKSGLDCPELDNCMARLKRLENTVTAPFFMEVFRRYQDGKQLAVKDLTHIFQITENYLFRRTICGVPTNSLNKIFLNLDREVLRYDETTHDYVNKFVYVLLSKKWNGRFPDDEEFSHALSIKEVYLMRGQYKTYLFERFENYGTSETQDVYTHLDKGEYSIEHIMPQHLTPTWMQALGTDAEEIHRTWLHRLGNLTLTAYNSGMSNASFQEKRDGEHGFKNSGLRMNQRIADKEKWGLSEIKERNEEMVNQATKKIWFMPVSTFNPTEKGFETISLDEVNSELEGRSIVKYSYQNAETPVSSWIDMFEHMVRYLHNEDKTILPSKIDSSATSSDPSLSEYFENKPQELSNFLKIDENLYVKRNTNTAQKIFILHRLFELFHANPTDLVFYLGDCDSKVQ